MNKPPRRMRIGPAASRAHREGSGAALFRLLAPFEEAPQDEVRPELDVPGRTWEAAQGGGVLTRYRRVHRLRDTPQRPRLRAPSCARLRTASRRGLTGWATSGG